jgi:hypothetical protein
MKSAREKSIWCETNDKIYSQAPNISFILHNDEIQTLKEVLGDETRNRLNAFRSLMSKSLKNGYKIDIDFISHFSGYFKVDEDCICKELLDTTSSRENYIFKVGKLLAAGKVGSAYLLKYDDSYFILKSIRRGLISPRPYLRLHAYSLSDLFRLQDMNPGLGINYWVSNKKPKLLAVGGDNFSNQTCLHMALNEILKENPNYVYQYDAFYCGDGGYNITELAMKGDLSSYLDSVESVDEDFLYDLFEQILSVMSIVKDPLYSFVHADFKCRNVFVTIDDGRPVYQLADFDKSSIFYRGLRFYNNTGDYRFSDLPFEVQDGDEGKYYVIDNYQIRAGTPIQVFTMHNPYGFYLSFDLYTFFYSLMMEPTVWSYIEKNQDDSFIFSVWKDMWYADDFPKVMEQIFSQHLKLETMWGTEAKNELANMRSIRTISNIFYSLNLKLKVDLSNMYEKFNLEIRESESNIENREITISKGKHLCIEECRKSTGWRGGNKCKTNTFSSAGSIYDWDWC